MMKNIIKMPGRRVAAAAACAFYLAGFSASGADDAGAPPPGAGVSMFHEAVSEWSALRAQAASEAREWKRQKELLEQELRFAGNEKTAIADRLAEAEREAAEFDRTLAALAEEKNALETTLSQVCLAMDTAELALEEWASVCPPWFGLEIKAGLRALKAGRETDSGRGAAERLSALLEVYAAVESAHMRVHARRDIVKGSDGAEREMETLYLGLSRGFAVSGDNRLAATGAALPGGWVWTPADEHAAAIRAAMEIHGLRRRAGLARLPLRAADTEDVFDPDQ